MSTEAKTPKIYEALIKANELVGAISKGNTNQQLGFKFRGVDDVYNSLHPILAKCGIVIVPEVVSHEVTERQARNGVLLYTRATIRHHFTASDGSSVTTLVVGEAMDSGDKGMSKAMSIALKYALFQLFTIPTDEDKDPDATTHELVPQATQATTSPDYQNKVEGAINELAKASSLDELANIFRSLPKEMQDDRSVKGEATRLKAVFAQKTAKK